MKPSFSPNLLLMRYLMVFAAMFFFGRMLHAKPSQHAIELKAHFVGKNKHKKTSKTTTAAASPNSLENAPQKVPQKEEEDVIEDVDIQAQSIKQETVAPLGNTLLPLTKNSVDPLSPWKIILGRLHAAFVHLPIAWLLLWALMSTVYCWDERNIILNTLAMLGCWTVVGFIPAIISGSLRLNELPQTPETLVPAYLHRNLMFGAWGVVLFLICCHLFCRSLLYRPWGRRIYSLLLWCVMALMGYAAHLGGKMVYGDDFLPF